MVVLLWMLGRKRKRCNHYQVFDVVAESDHVTSRHICNCAVLLKTLECVVSRYLTLFALSTLVLFLLLIESMMKLIRELSAEYLC